MKVIAHGWDLAILHPPCTHLCVSGNRYYGANTPGMHKRRGAIVWTMDLWRAAQLFCDRVCLENPVGVLPLRFQYIQPWMFGHPESKKTGLALHNLPPLVPTAVLEPPAGRVLEAGLLFPVTERGYWENQTPSGQNKLGPSPDRAQIRSATYPGVSWAMADQWGGMDEQKGSDSTGAPYNL